MYQYQDKGDHEVEDQPDINHLDVGSLGELVVYANKHCREDKHGCKVNRNNSFKEKILKQNIDLKIKIFLILKKLVAKPMTFNNIVGR